MEEGSTAGGSMAVAVLAIRITTEKLVVRRITGGGSMVVAGSTIVADMDISITTIKLAARRADRLPACIVKEEGIITEGGSMVVGIKVEG